jgi:hypothetical protein
MTRARALRLLERHASMLDSGSELREAFEVAAGALRPKPRAVKAGQMSPAAKTIVRNLARPDGFRWNDAAQTAAYLDAFGAKGSPEREAQALRLRAMENGPDAVDYGRPARPERFEGKWSAEKQAEDDRALREYGAAVDAWAATSQGEGFEAARAKDAARRRQFGYTRPKGRLDDATLATYVRAFMGADALEVDDGAPALPVAA